MKRIVLALILLYQISIVPIIKQVLGISTLCRYSPSCSEYAKIVITQYGIIKGGWFAFLRLLSCQPFVKQNHV